jgi:hypothetical protein
MVARVLAVAVLTKTMGKQRHGVTVMGCGFAHWQKLGATVLAKAVCLAIRAVISTSSAFGLPRHVLSKQLLEIQRMQQQLRNYVLQPMRHLACAVVKKASLRSPCLLMVVLVIARIASPEPTMKLRSCVRITDSVFAQLQKLKDLVIAIAARPATQDAIWMAIVSGHQPTVWLQ